MTNSRQTSLPTDAAKGRHRLDDVVVVGSANAAIGLPAAWAILRSGGSALDAVEAATKVVEDNDADHSVGYSGLPNLIGDVELDAAIMDGERRRVGAVGALKNVRHPISVARAVMDHLPHTFLAGEGAARFAAEFGFKSEELLTDESRRIWREGLESRLPDGLARYEDHLARMTSLAIDPHHVAGTVNVLARDCRGHLACAVSTSGWAWKYPGRIGDTPVVGAGIYADDRYGAAACTGMGELSMRACLAHSIVARMAAGQDKHAAGRAALHDMEGMALEFATSAVMEVVVLDPNGESAAFSSFADRMYVAMDANGSELRHLPRTHVEWPGVSPLDLIRQTK